MGDTEVVIFQKKHETGNVSTVLIRGSTQLLMDDIERAIDGAVNTFKALTKDNQVLYLSKCIFGYIDDDFSCMT